eukprot:CAMPEP_0181180294 /NCGR_PEP_ID=MMETSP1096-20121128/6720_1 /TAXON_ID=156174 ORGANISM="Chrysochromulina ericina, Strain CCMP281" /NCGR_SAMPLE_ID=MMETSP1096 /ASSEMBLY_ACC=CAM_ASM_000453 /LENGTH=80 /DNA_ID=CAMNT_0023268707 /DNA_START=584 /DNA_END=826 /DNA_ORIENTATION=+
MTRTDQMPAPALPREGTATEVTVTAMEVTAMEVTVTALLCLQWCALEPSLHQSRTGYGHTPLPLSSHSQASIAAPTPTSW